LLVEFDPPVTKLILSFQPENAAVMRQGAVEKNENAWMFSAKCGVDNERAACHQRSIRSNLGQ
jgi:hypothetical protein